LPPEGWGIRWVKGRPEVPGAEFSRDKSSLPADEHIDGSSLKWVPSAPNGEIQWIVYHHWLLDEAREETIRDWFAYNGAALQQELSDVHDFSVEFDVEVGAGTGSLALKLYDGQNAVTAEIPVTTGDRATDVVRLSGVDASVDVVTGVCLKERQTHHVEFAFVD